MSHCRRSMHALSLQQKCLLRGTEMSSLQKDRKQVAGTLSAASDTLLTTARWEGPITRPKWNTQSWDWRWSRDEKKRTNKQKKKLRLYYIRRPNIEDSISCLDGKSMLQLLSSIQQISTSGCGRLCPKQLHHLWTWSLRHWPLTTQFKRGEKRSKQRKSSQKQKSLPRRNSALTHQHFNVDENLHFVQI